MELLKVQACCTELPGSEMPRRKEAGLRRRGRREVAGCASYERSAGGLESGGLPREHLRAIEDEAEGLHRSGRREPVGGHIVTVRPHPQVRIVREDCRAELESSGREPVGIGRG